jgi:hypothetical protein
MRVMTSMLFGKVTRDQWLQLQLELSAHLDQGTLHSLFHRPQPPVACVPPAEHFSVDIVDDRDPAGLTVRLVVGLTSDAPFTLQDLASAAASLLSGQLTSKWCSAPSFHLLPTAGTETWLDLQYRLWNDGTILRA